MRPLPADPAQALLETIEKPLRHYSERAHVFHRDKCIAALFELRKVLGEKVLTRRLMIEVVFRIYGDRIEPKHLAQLARRSRERSLSNGN